jgi:hypothetical protein
MSDRNRGAAKTLRQPAIAWRFRSVEHGVESSFEHIV